MGWREELAAARSAPLDTAALARVVAGLHPGAQVRDTAPLEGGLAGLCDVVRLDGAPVERLVLRRNLPSSGHDEAGTRVEVAAHRVAGRHGVPAPAVRWADPAGGVLGRPAMLLDFVPGRPIVRDLDDRRAARAFAASVGAVHEARPGADSGLSLLADVEAHVDRFGASPDRSDLVDAPALIRTVTGLVGAFRPADGLVHGDLHGGNVLWDGTAVTGVLDWPGAARGVRWWDEAYAVLDTTLAHGEPAGGTLVEELRARRDAPAPADDEWALWQGVAMLRALPSPRPWHDGYLAAGCTVEADVVERRFVEQVAAYTALHG